MGPQRVWKWNKAAFGERGQRWEWGPQRVVGRDGATREGKQGRRGREVGPTRVRTGRTRRRRRGLTRSLTTAGGRLFHRLLPTLLVISLPHPLPHPHTHTHTRARTHSLTHTHTERGGGDISCLCCGSDEDGGAGQHEGQRAGEGEGEAAGACKGGAAGAPEGDGDGEARMASDGEVVELRSFESGFEGAWFKVIIMQLWALEARVDYWYFTKKGPGERAHTEIARLENLRPLPPQPERECVSWEVRDAVETRWMDAWWQGYIKSFDAATNKYRVYYGGGVPDLDIPGSLIRARLDWVPLSGDPSKSVWAPAENMQDPPVWVKVRMKKTPVKMTTPAMKTTAMKKRPVAQIRPRVSVPASHVGDESEAENKLDGASWEVMEARRQKKIPRALTKSQSAPMQKFKKFKFVCGLTPKIACALPAIKPPPKPTSEQTIVSITPGSSPPLAESPVQGFESSSGSDSQAQESLATPEVSPPTKASSIPSCSRGSGSSNSTSSGDDDNDCGESENGDRLAEEDVPTSSFLHPFPDFSNETTRKCMAVYHQLLQCFLNDPKGYLDQTRERILKDIKDELSLPTDLCNEAHCAVFGLPPVFLNR